MTCRTLVALLIAMPTVVQNQSYASVVEFTNSEEWQSAADEFTTIDFTEFPADTFITNQYTDYGIHFTGVNLVTGPTPGFPNDGFGLLGPSGIHFVFDFPQSWVAVDYPGGLMFELYNNGRLIYTSTFFAPGGLGHFAGLNSSEPFDEVMITRPWPDNINLFIDDLHFGTIPAPGALGILALGLLFASSRRRRSEN